MHFGLKHVLFSCSGRDKSNLEPLSRLGEIYLSIWTKLKICCCSKKYIDLYCLWHSKSNGKNGEWLGYEESKPEPSKGSVTSKVSTKQ